MAKPLEFRPHSYFVDFTSRAPFYIMTSLPAFIKVGKTPADPDPTSSTPHHSNFDDVQNMP
jgi:hypothetical protein